MSDTESEFVTCLCISCSGRIEFERASFDLKAPALVACPHCGLETQLYIPKPIARTPGLPPPSPSISTASHSPSKDATTLAPPLIQRPNVSNAQFLSDLCKWGILLWTALCVIGAAFGFLNIMWEHAKAPSTFNEYPTAATLGIIAGMSIWGIIWGLLAISATVVWLITKPRQK
jgi:hypothetical protein